jgi:hypothetical protein
VIRVQQSNTQREDEQASKILASNIVLPVGLEVRVWAGVQL